MKSTEEYINEVYKKYAQTQEQNIKYKVVKMRPRRPLIPLCVIVACLLAVGYIGFGLKNRERLENPKITDYVQKEENENKIYTDILMADAKFNDKYLKYLVEESTDIVLTSNYNKKEVVCEVLDESVVLKTLGNLKIDNILKGNTNISDKILCERKGGIKSFKELEAIPEFDWNKIDKNIIHEDISEDQKANTFYEQKSVKETDFESGKQYLVFLKYNEETNIYEIFESVLGIMEYDPQTNKIKNIDTGEFEEFNWDLIK